MAKLIDSKTKATAFLDSIDTFLFDMDGVLWHGTELLPNVRETITMLHDMNKTVVFVTNNSTKSRKNYQKKLGNFGIACSESHIIGSSYAATYYVKKRLPENSKLFLIAQENGGLQEELDNEKVPYLANYESDLLAYNPEKDKDWDLDPAVKGVLVGFDGHLTFRKLARAQLYLSSNPNMLFVATNQDSTYPLGNKLFPGTGAIVQAVATAAGREPVVCGKPSEIMLECVLEKFKLNPDRTCMVGDRLNTDILFGKSGKMKTMAVLTGVTTAKELETTDIVPDYYILSLGELHTLFNM